MKMQDFQNQDFCKLFEFVQIDPGSLQPAGHLLSEVCVIQSEGGSVCLKLATDALSHPTLAPSLEEIALHFSRTLVGDEVDPSKLAGALESKGLLEVGSRTLLVREEDRWIKVSLKGRSRFWPFGR